MHTVSVGTTKLRSRALFRSKSVSSVKCARCRIRTALCLKTPMSLPSAVPGGHSSLVSRAASAGILFRSLLLDIQKPCVICSCSNEQAVGRYSHHNPYCLHDFWGLIASSVKSGNSHRPRSREEPNKDHLSLDCVTDDHCRRLFKQDSFG